MISGFPSNKLFIVIITKLPANNDADSFAEFYGTSNNFKLTFITSYTKFLIDINDCKIHFKNLSSFNNYKVL